MGEILSGKEIAEQIYQDNKEELEELVHEFKIEPKWIIITAGYQNLKERELILHINVAKKLGISTTTIALGDDASEEELIAKIQDANNDINIHGILVLLPLSKHLDQERILQAIAPEKELEGLRDLENNASPPSEKKPSTIAAVLTLLEKVDFNLLSERAVLIIEDEILEANQIVSNLIEITQKLHLPLEIVKTSNPNSKIITCKADVVLVSVSEPNYIDETFLKEGGVVIDFNPIVVGEEYSKQKNSFVPILKSGVNVESALTKARYVAPAIGGIGPVALALMMRNFVTNYRTLVSSPKIKNYDN
jgi:methylenetetrahydrofolate dehydrogenase (NADP+)/methenyltetrahydrofolate cyclohydrolase